MKRELYLRKVEEELTEYKGELNAAIDRYKNGPITPGVVSVYWKAKMKFEGRKVGRDIEVSNCDWSEEEIQQPMVDINGNHVPGMMVYIPPRFLKDDGYSFIGKLFPELQSSGVVIPPYYYSDIHDTPEWVKVEASIYAPNLNSNEQDIETLQKMHGYLGQRAKTYIFASYASKDLLGEHFDYHGNHNIEGWTSSRLPGSLDQDGRMCIADIYSKGSIHTNPRTSPDSHFQWMGARFEEVKR